MNTHNFLARWRESAALVAAFAAIASLALSPVARGATVTYTNSDCTGFAVSGTPPNQTVTCVGAGGAPVCAPTANPASPVAGQATTISANCSNLPTANSYVWTDDSNSSSTCAQSTGSTCSVAKSRARTVTFTVSASNASGRGAAAEITVTWR